MAELPYPHSLSRTRKEAVLLDQGEVSVPKHAAAPSSVDISITGRCNLNCKYCFYSGEMAALSDLSTEGWKSIIRKLGEAKVMRIILTGGEVFTRYDIFEIIDSIIDNKMRYSILTNGTLIDEEAVSAFSAGKRRLRLDSIQVSIDGSCPEVHNLSRPSSFDRAVNGLKLLMKEGFPATVRVTINRHNMDDLENIAELLLDDIGLPSFSNNEASPIGAGCTCESEIALDHVDTLRAGLQLEKLLEKYPGRITANAGPLARLRMYREMEDARKTGQTTGRWKMGFLSSCGGVFDRLGILHDGSIVCCSILHDLTIGNMLTDDLLEVWKNNSVIKEVRDRYIFPLSEIPACANCEWVQYCNGGCPGVTLQIQKNLLEPSWRECYRNFLKANGIGSIYDVVT